MRRGQRQHQEERAILVGLNEFEAARKEALGQPVHLRVFFGDLHARFRVVHFQRLHVVAVGQAIEQVEAVLCRRPERRHMPEMPLADQRGRVVGLQRLRDGDLRQRQAVGVGLADHIARKARADRIAPRHQSRAGRRADIRRGIERRQSRALGRHAINVRRADHAVAEHAKIAIAEIVAQDQHDIRLAAGRLTKRRRRTRRKSIRGDGGKQELATIHDESLRVEVQLEAGAGPAALIELARTRRRDPGIAHVGAAEDDVGAQQVRKRKMLG